MSERKPLAIDEKFRRALKRIGFDPLFRPDGIGADACGPFMPPMLRWERAERAKRACWPFVQAIPAAPAWRVGEQLSLALECAA